MRQHLSFREHFRRGNAEASDNQDANLATGGALQGPRFLAVAVGR